MSFDSCKDMLSLYTRTVVLLIEWWDLEVSAADEFTSFDLVPIQAMLPDDFLLFSDWFMFGKAEVHAPSWLNGIL